MSIHTYNFADITGATHKELGVDEIVDNALSKDLEGIVVISSGNFSFAIQEEITRRESSLKLFNLVGRKSRSNSEIEIPNGDILKTNEQRVSVVRDATGLNIKIQDYTDFIPNAYGVHAEVILASTPDYVLCPIGSGKLWLSIVRKVQSLDISTKVIGVTPKGRNAFFLNNLTRNLDSVADKLTAPYTHLREEVLAESPNHIVAEASERQLKKAYNKAKQRNIECEPSGAAGFVVYDQKFCNQHEIDKSDDVVVVSTGKGFKYEVDQTRNTECKRRSKIGTLATLFVAGTFCFLAQTMAHISDQQIARELLSTMNSKTDYRALVYMAEREGVSSIMSLSADGVSMAGTLSMMDQTGLDYIVHSQDPKKAAMYRDFVSKCPYDNKTCL
ncbi:pyridoxal-phosphate dependent enzyme [Candidatus Woesearchaeota archaeon]|nr:pyridoxal-phosphate dependent enzyme [Candidatus Woesearchaeota archaeon]MBT4110780.1 pyridoxal-phosphate dependent enzyme [Candidatus Woesearchaeota archaeon]MBT4336708.1 pyridoxal-phosphate dependent enzyme [Candidatus Woesearchaeota archaeon]MBT4469543.1 pyridoxal-phosphate dependent enzyme [Candidatus Woesearchaeota archaeon]MBT6743905.1 pyridoxal-phosphate dependent enzyme [Candidatus Woesearchaeota archaeon]